MILHNALEQNLDAHAPAVVAAGRWRTIREKLLKLAGSRSDESGDVLEALCFLVDETLVDENLRDYRTGLEEVASTLLRETSDVSLQMLVAAELQKLAIPS